MSVTTPELRDVPSSLTILRDKGLQATELYLVQAYVAEPNTGADATRVKVRKLRANGSVQRKQTYLLNDTNN